MCQHRCFIFTPKDTVSIWWHWGLLGSSIILSSCSWDDCMMPQWGRPPNFHVLHKHLAEGGDKEVEPLIEAHAKPHRRTAGRGYRSLITKCKLLTSGGPWHGDRACWMSASKPALVLKVFGCTPSTRFKLRLSPYIFKFVFNHLLKNLMPAWAASMPSLCLASNLYSELASAITSSL